jgi:predicted enzyme related to lactoylglutathione lyase
MAPQEGTMFLGLRTAIYHVDDIDKGKRWYSEVLGVQPYFDQPFYVGFNISGYELGLQPGAITSADKADGAVAYWGVENAAAAFKRIVDLGATVNEALQDVGEGIKVATVKDPFGNIFGIIENPNFKLQ